MLTLFRVLLLALILGVALTPMVVSNAYARQSADTDTDDGGGGGGGDEPSDDGCPAGKERVNGHCVARCPAGQSRDENGNCRSNSGGDQGGNQGGDGTLQAGDCLSNPNACTPDVSKMTPEQRAAAIESLLPSPDPDTISTVGVGCYGIDKAEPADPSIATVKAWLSGACRIPAAGTIRGSLPCSVHLGLGATDRASGEVPPDPARLRTVQNAVFVDGYVYTDAIPFHPWVREMGELIHRGLTVETRLAYDGKRFNFGDPKNPLAFKGPVCIELAGEGKGGGLGQHNVKGESCGNFCELKVKETDDKYEITIKNPATGKPCQHENAWFKGQGIVAKHFFWLGLMQDFAKYGMVQLTDFDGVKPCGKQARDILRTTKKLEISLRMLEKIYQATHPTADPKGWVTELQCKDPAKAAPGVCSLSMARRQLQAMWSKMIQCEMNARAQKDFLVYDPAKQIVEFFKREKINDKIGDAVDDADSVAEGERILNEKYREMIPYAASVQTFDQVTDWFGRDETREGMIKSAAKQGGTVTARTTGANIQAGSCGVVSGNEPSQQQYSQSDINQAARNPAYMGYNYQNYFEDYNMDDGWLRNKYYNENQRYQTFDTNKARTLIIEPVRSLKQSDIDQATGTGPGAALTPKEQKREGDAERVLASLGLMPFFAIGSLSARRRKISMMTKLALAVLAALVGPACGKGHSDACEIHKSGPRLACERVCPCDFAEHNLAPNADDDTCPAINVFGAAGGSTGGNNADNANKNIDDFFNAAPTLSGSDHFAGGNSETPQGGQGGGCGAGFSSDDLNCDGKVDDIDKTLAENAATALNRDGDGTGPDGVRSVAIRGPATAGGANNKQGGGAATAAKGGAGSNSGAGLLGGGAASAGGTGSAADKSAGGDLTANAATGAFEGGAAGGRGAGGSGYGYGSGTGDVSPDGSGGQQMEAYLAKTGKASLFEIVSRRYDTWGKDILK